MHDLRPYQQEAVQAIKSEFAAGVKSTLLVMATGTGKTRCFTELAKSASERGKRTLALAHRAELLKQTKDSFESARLSVGVEKAESRGFGLFDTVVASVQTLSRADRLAQYPRDYFDLIITDEAHHATADSYRRIYSHFDTAYHLGVTATPNRHDEIGLRNIYSSCAFQYPIQEGIKDGFLCNIIGKQVQVKDLKLESVKIVAGEFSQPELDEMLRMESVLKAMVLPTIEHAGNRPTIVFTPGVEHAHEIAACFNRTAERPVAVAIDGGMDDVTRRNALRQFESGRIQFLVNVGICTEGYDHPPTSCIALFRPTRSLGMLAQMIGRGTRTAPGKDNCLVLDFVGVDNCVRTMTVSDVLDGSILNEAEHAKAQELQEQGYNAVEALKEAKSFVAQLDSIKAKMSALSTANAFDVLKMFAVPSCKGKWGGDLITQKQKDFILKCGIAVPNGMQKGEAHALIEQIIKRREKGLATFKQMRYARGLGCKDNFIETWTFQEMSEWIEKHAQKRAFARA